MSQIINPHDAEKPQLQIVVPIEQLFQRFLEIAVQKAKRELELEAEVARLEDELVAHQPHRCCDGR